MSDQNSSQPDPIEYWLSQWSQLSAPIHSLIQNPIAHAFLQESNEALQQAVNYWGKQEHGYADLAQQMSARVAELLSQQDLESTDATVLQQHIADMQSVVAKQLATLIDATECLTERQKKLLGFNLRQLGAMVNPKNAFLSNPELVTKATETQGQMLLDASNNYFKDIADSQFGLQIKRSSEESLELGVDIAATPGSVIYQNELIQLIHYQSTCSRQYQIPLLVVPPCINRFYIFDLMPDKSMVRWLLDQGQDVYMISWVNPGADLRDLNFEDYVRKGCLHAVEVATEISGSHQVNLAGYCIGGLIAAIAAATEKGREQIASLSLFATLLDYSEPGELGIFTSPDILDAICAQIGREGVLSADMMSTAFTFLREEQLFWHFFRSRYLRGEEAVPDALMRWGQDSTNLPGAMAVEYFRGFYSENQLCSDNVFKLGAEVINLKSSSCPKYVLACDRDHIVPSIAAIDSTNLLSGEMRIVQASGGHVRGVFNHPDQQKGNYRLFNQGDSQPGSWWDDWYQWLEQLSRQTLESKICAPAQYSVIESAPGSYVRG